MTVEFRASPRSRGAQPAQCGGPAPRPGPRPTKAIGGGRQRGVTLFGLMFWAVVIGFFALVGMKVLPTLNEYFTIKKAVTKIANDNVTTVPEIRAAFDRIASIEYSIASIKGKDLAVSKENDKVVIGFAYDKQIELISPVFILIKYEGRSN